MSDSSTAPPPSVAEAREYLRTLLLETTDARGQTAASALPGWVNRTVYDLAFGSSSSQSGSSLPSSSDGSDSTALATASRADAAASCASGSGSCGASGVSAAVDSSLSRDTDSSSHAERLLSMLNSTTTAPIGKNKKSHKLSASLAQSGGNASGWEGKDASLSGRASRVSTTHIIGYFLLFAVFSVLTVWLVNMFMRRRQHNADAAKADEEMVGFAPHGSERSLPESTTKVEVSTPSPPSSSPNTEGNSSRQRFLQSRREAAQRSYGATEHNDAAEL